MKKFTMLSSVLASALMLTVASCSSEDVAGGDAQNGKGATSYLAVNIENVGSAPASRIYEQNKGTYEDGTADESKITNVRFYFFNGDGTPYLLVNKNSDNDSEKQPVNYLEQKVETDGNDHDHTAEIKTKAVLVLNGETKAVPASVIAVINPEVLDNTTLHSGTMTLSELRTSATGSTFYDTTNGFVMSNSVYESAGQDVCSTPVANNVFASSDAALKKPVDIYVERVNAKVNAKIDADYVRTNETEKAWSKNAEGKYQINVGNIDVTTYAENTNATPTTYPVYAVVQGWQVADANGKAEVCKQINTAWYAGELGFSPWTTSDYHRCFWSKSVPFTSGAQGGVNQPVNPKFENIKLSLSGDFSTTPVYTLPNTPTEVIANPTTSLNTLTKLIVAAKLVYKDENGDYKPAQICQYRGLTYLGEEAVKKQIVGGFARYFKKTTTESGDVYKSIEASDIAFKTVVPGSPESSEVKNCEVVATLASTVGDLYVKNGETWTKASKDDVNAALAKETAQVRSTDGATYYYTPIKHLGEAGKLGEYGIVRNHSYQVTIQNIKGFGTPVYDPKKEIDPMIPSDENTYLAASIKVLSWRVVSSKVDLDQTK